MNRNPRRSRNRWSPWWHVALVFALLAHIVMLYTLHLIAPYLTPEYDKGSTLMLSLIHI